MEDDCHFHIWKLLSPRRKSSLQSALRAFSSESYTFQIVVPHGHFRPRSVPTWIGFLHHGQQWSLLHGPNKSGLTLTQTPVKLQFSSQIAMKIASWFWVDLITIKIDCGNSCPIQTGFECDTGTSVGMHTLSLSAEHFTWLTTSLKRLSLGIRCANKYQNFTECRCHFD